MRGVSTLPYLSEVCQVGLVAHQHHRGFRGTAHAINKLLEVAGFLEAPSVGNGIGDDEALACPHVLTPIGCKTRPE